MNLQREAFYEAEIHAESIKRHHRLTHFWIITVHVRCSMKLKASQATLQVRKMP